MVRYIILDKKINKITKYSWIQWNIAFFIVWVSGIITGIALSKLF